MPASTLDAFFAGLELQRVRLLKIDCEGAEGIILEGGEDVIRHQVIEFVAIDYHPRIIGPEACLRTHQKLVAAGYVLTRAGGLYIYHLQGLDQHLLPLGGLRVNCAWGD